MNDRDVSTLFPIEQHTAARVALEATAQRLRILIASQSPQRLLGYLYGALLLHNLQAASPDKHSSKRRKRPATLPALNTDDAQFVLEYVHAVYATTPIQADVPLDESICKDIVCVAHAMKDQCLMLAMMLAAGSSSDHFGPETKTVLFHALSGWILLRGHRYQVLEEEFFRFSLQTHDDVLRRTYGVGAVDIARGIQQLSDATRIGHMNAALAMNQSREDAFAFLTEQNTSISEGVVLWRAQRPDQVEKAQTAYVDLFLGGICCVSRHSQLPIALLDDLAFSPGEETDFFAPGPYSGTPFRTLPARKKPLIKLDGEHYVTDPSFARDAAYRAILYNLQLREPLYKSEFLERQKSMSESAFANVFAQQLRGATIVNEVYYRQGKNWFENDTLILLDDVLVLVEAKSGAAATIASPANDFDRHARDVRDLIVKAYDQCRRFLDYLASADEVPLFRLTNGHHEEILRIRLADYRLVLPIGLTVESYSPFSTQSKELPGVVPLLDRHPFISVAIDELLVLGHFLPTTGQLMHYWQIRQELAGLRTVFLFDELDHLGAYIVKNRIAADLHDRPARGADMVVVDGMSNIVDQYFAQPDWDARPPPAQPFPAELTNLLSALDRTRAPGWLEVDGHVRDYAGDARDRIASTLEPLRKSLGSRPHRYVVIPGPPPLLIWLHRDDEAVDETALRAKAHAAAIAFAAPRVLAVTAGVDLQGRYARVAGTHIVAIGEPSPEILSDAEAMKKRPIALGTASHHVAGAPARKPGRNEPCWCGSGAKYKKCHGP